MAIVAHPDDEIIGLGGTLAKHVSQGDNVSVLILGDGKSSRKSNYSIPSTEIKMAVNKETLNALKIIGVTSFKNLNFPDNRFDSKDLLDIVKAVSESVSEQKPEIIYTHHFGDLNIDHYITSKAVITACRPIENNFVKEIYMFETLSSTEMAGFLSSTVFLPNTFVDIKKFIDKKIKSMSFYKSELRKYPHPRSLKSIKLNAQIWGTKNNIEYAEAFFCFRRII